MREHLTSQGDTWDKVAYELYGDEARMDELLKANPEYRRIVEFEEPVLIKVPDLSDSDGLSVEDRTAKVPWED